MTPVRTTAAAQVALTEPALRPGPEAADTAAPATAPAAFAPVAPPAAAESALPASRRAAAGWRLALPALCIVWGFTLVVHRDTLAAMVDIWSRSDTFAHAWLVAPISAWLAWRLRERIATLTPRPQPALLAALAAAGAAWLAGDLVLVNAAMQFALVALLVLAVPAVLGWTVTRAVLFPLGFLFFAVPFGEFMLPTMMDWTADFTVAALQFSGIPVYREGLQFVIPSGHWSVVEACSGVRYLIASFMVGTLFAYLNYRSTRRRVAFMAVALLLPVLANWLRAYIIVMLGHLSGNTVAVGVDHLIYGWLFFGIVVTAMFLVGARWSEADAQADAVAAPGTGDLAGPARSAASAASAASAPSAPSALRVAAVAGAALVVLGLPPLAGHALRAAEDAVRPLAPDALRLPATLAGWQDLGEPVTEGWEPRWTNPSAQVARRFGQGPRALTLQMAYYRQQGPQRKLVSAQNSLVPSNERRFNLLHQGRDAASGQALHAADILVDDRAAQAALGGRHLVVWRLYWIDGRWIAGDAAAKIAGVASRLAGHGDEGAVLMLHAAGDDAAAARATLQAFVDAGALPALSQRLAAVRDAR